MKNFEARSLSDFVPSEETDEFGYVWKKVQREHTLEIVGYDGEVEMGSIVLNHDSSEAAAERAEEISWVQERTDILYPDGCDEGGGQTLGRNMEIIRQQYETYKK